MSKYLLLRDNKQSGPFTVAELIEKGIRPYDLVWLEGKSAAWRYPSEVEELKAYSPAIEEQPLDRFYKRPEPASQAKSPAKEAMVEHAAYVPKVETVPVEESSTQKKVYVNFPVKPQPKKSAEPNHKFASTASLQPVSQSRFTDSASTIPAKYTPAPPVSNIPSKKDNRPLYISAAACVVLIGFIAVLFVNNSRQQQRLKEFNTIVKQIETRNATGGNAAIQQVKNELPPAPAPEVSETIVNPELLNVEDHNSPEKTPAQQAQAVSQTTKPATKNAASKSEANGDIVFTERPVVRRGDDQPSTPGPVKQATTETSGENLFKLVSVAPNKYKTGVLGGISNLQLHLTNNSRRELQKVAVQINYLGPEKKVVNSQTVYFENVPAGTESTIDVPRSKRGVSINYTITDIKS